MFYFSGLDGTSSVASVHLRCSGGRISWQYPQGGVRVVYTRPHEFRLCVKASQSFSGARVFVEGHGELRPFLWRGDGSHLNKVRCVHSENGRLALYIEAESTQSSRKKQTVDFKYDIQKIPQKDLYDNSAGKILII